MKICSCLKGDFNNKKVMKGNVVRIRSLIDFKLLSVLFNVLQIRVLNEIIQGNMTRTRDLAHF